VSGNGKPDRSRTISFLTAALRKRSEASLDRTITSWTSERDRWEVTRLLQGAGVRLVPVYENKGFDE